MNPNNEPVEAEGTLGGSQTGKSIADLLKRLFHPAARRPQRWESGKLRKGTRHANGRSGRTCQGIAYDRHGNELYPRTVPSRYWKDLGDGFTSDMSEHARRRHAQKLAHKRRAERAATP